MKFGVVALLSMALFAMAFAAVPIASANPGPYGSCAYINSAGRVYLGGSYNWHVYSSNALGTCCNDQLWAALWVELWVDGTHIPPIDVQSPFSRYFTSTTTDVTFSTWATHACAAGCTN